MTSDPMTSDPMLPSPMTSDPRISTPLLTSLSQLQQPLLDAIFLERPHRFALRVWLPDLEEEAIAHLGDPGRLGHLLTPGQALKLDGPFPTTKRKTQYTAILAQTPEQTWVSLVTQLPNRLFAPLLHHGHLPWLWQPPQELPLIQREVTCGHSRIDIRLSNTHSTTNTWIELKSVTWAQGTQARFPDAPTQRGLRHLHTLAELHHQGHRACVLFIIGRDDVQTFSPAAEIDPDFAHTLTHIHQEGVEIHALSIQLTPEAVYFDQLLAFSF